MAKKLLHIIGQFVLKFFSRENVSNLIDQLIDALYEGGHFIREDNDVEF